MQPHGTSPTLLPSPPRKILIRSCLFLDCIPQRLKVIRFSLELSCSVRHETLLSRLRSRFGVDGKALDWFASYLADRSQRVAVEGGVSSTFPLKQGVPQGSCLGPILFSLFDIVEKPLPSVHCYADDSQLYLAFSPNVPGDDEIALNAMCDCI